MWSPELVILCVSHSSFRKHVAPVELNCRNLPYVFLWKLLINHSGRVVKTRSSRHYLITAHTSTHTMTVVNTALFIQNKSLNRYPVGKRCFPPIDHHGSVYGCIIGEYTASSLEESHTFSNDRNRIRSGIWNEYIWPQNAVFLDVAVNQANST